MKQQYFFLFVFLFGLKIQIFAQSELLQSGPMVGYSTMKEVLLWVQTTESASIQFQYYPKEEPKNRQKSEEITTNKEEAFTAQFILEVQPSTKYVYELYINNQLVERPYPLEFQSQTLWQYRTDPPAFSFAFGSCFYVNEPELDRPGDSYGGDYQIMESLFEKDPDLMVWGGDNIYLREADWNSQTGIFHRYTHTRSLPELQALLGSVHHYATLDDHDFGPNDSDRSFWNKNKTLKAFKLFWGNPNYIFDDAITGTFTWNDVQFFILDGRSYRSPNHDKVTKRELLGEKQMQWLLEALTYSKASFKFVVVGGQVINSADVFENHATYAEERQKLIDGITERDIRGVVFLSGDRHHSEISMMPRENTYPLYDITVSPLTSETHAAADEDNQFRISDTHIAKRNFAIFEVSGKFRERVCNLTLYDSEGEELLTYEIKQEDLK